MYEADDQDRVVPLDGFPQSSVGAPCPLILSDESVTYVAYYKHVRDPNWDGTYVTEVSPSKTKGPVVVVCFEDTRAQMSGPPNDEAFAGHPLAKRGLEPYGAFEVMNSSWVRKLEKMNRVHPSHRPDLYEDDRHFILTFHDSIFECVASGFIVEEDEGPVNSAMARVVGRL